MDDETADDGVVMTHADSVLDTYRTLPPALRKACDDPHWRYAVETRQGTIFLFHGAKPLPGGWVRLLETDESDAPCLAGDFHFTNDSSKSICEVGCRGVEVHVTEIAWAADGGH